MSDVRGWFTLEAGIAVRGQLRREVEGEAWRRGLDIETKESKGLLESVYRFTVRGESAAVRRFIGDVSEWLADLVVDESANSSCCLDGGET